MRRELEDVSDVEAHVLDVEHRSDEPPALAFGAAEDDVGQELHLDRLGAVAAARLAAAAGHVEREDAGLVPTFLGERRGGKPLSEDVPNLQICRSVAA